MAAEIERKPKIPLHAVQPFNQPVGDVIEQEGMAAEYRGGTIAAQPPQASVKNFGGGHQALVPRQHGWDKRS